MMKTYLLSAAAALAVSSAAYAGGMAEVQVEPVLTVVEAPAPVFDWTGGYVGVILGSNWTDTSTDD